MSYFLNSTELWQLMDIQGYKNDTSNGNITFKEYIKYIKENGVMINDNNLQKNLTLRTGAWYSHIELANELVKELDNKIELFSENFWSLFNLKINNGKVDWKNFSQETYDKKEKNIKLSKVNYLLNFKDNELWSNLNYYLKNSKTIETEYLELWYNLSSKKINTDSYSFIDKNSNVLLKAKCYGLFDNKYEKIEELYQSNKGTIYVAKLVKTLKKINPSFKENELILMKSENIITYRENFKIYYNYFYQKYDASEVMVSNFFKVLQFVTNSKTNKYFFQTQIENKRSEWSSQLNNIIYFASFSLFANSEYGLKEPVIWFKEIVPNLEKILFSKEKKHLLLNVNIANTLEHNNMEKFIQYIEKKILYDKLESQLEKKEVIQKNKVRKI